MEKTVAVAHNVQIVLYDVIVVTIDKKIIMVVPEIVVYQENVDLTVVVR